MATRSKLQVSYSATIFIVLGISIMAIGAVYPTSIGRTVEATIRFDLQTIVVITQPVPTFTVQIQGCDGQIYTPSQPSQPSGPTSISTCSPIYFMAKATANAQYVTSVAVNYQGTTAANLGLRMLTLTRSGSPPSGATFPNDPNAWYGVLPLTPDTWTVHATALWDNHAGSTGSVTPLSMIVYFGVAEPPDMRWYWGASVFIIGLVLAASGFLMVIPRKRGGP